MYIETKSFSNDLIVKRIEMNLILCLEMMAGIIDIHGVIQDQWVIFQGTNPEYMPIPASYPPSVMHSMMLHFKYQCIFYAPLIWGKVS